jgi:hypothetical protein
MSLYRYEDKGAFTFRPDNKISILSKSADLIRFPPKDSLPGYMSRSFYHLSENLEKKPYKYNSGA